MYGDCVGNGANKGKSFPCNRVSHVLLREEGNFHADLGFRTISAIPRAMAALRR